MRLKRIKALLLAAAMLISGGGLSAFADGYLPDPLKLETYAGARAPAGLPSEYSSPYSATRGQGDDDVGWAFAAVAAIEASGRAKGQLSPADTFSENHMRYALSSDGGNALGFDRRYTEAGSRRMVAAYLMRGELSGPVPSSADPYSAGGAGLSRPLSETSSRERELRATGVIYLPDATEGTEASALGRIKAHVREYGAVAASLNYGEDGYSSGFYRYTGDGDPNHAVVITGWDDSYSYRYTDEGGAGLTGYGAFLARDSEGASGRTFYLSYDTPLTDAYAIKGLSGELFDVTHEHDPFGPSSTIGFRSNTAWFANLFTVENKTEALVAVSFFAAGEDTSVEFYLAGDAVGGSAALQDAVQGSPLKLEGGAYSASFALPGYYTVKLAGPVPVTSRGGAFAVIARATTACSTEPIPLQATGTSASGQSFISGDGSHWIDTAVNNSAAVCLKAHTEKDMDIPMTGIEITAPAALEGALEGGVLHMSTGSSLKLEVSPLPRSATNAGPESWYVRNPGGAGFISPGSTLPPSETDVIRLDPASGRLTAVREGTAYVRVAVRSDAVTGLLAAPGGMFEHTLEVRVSDVAAVEIALSATEAEITTAQTLALSATVLPEDATDKELVWTVASDRWGTRFPLEADIEDPYGESRPVASVDDGTVKPLRPGECWVFARTRDGGAEAGCHVIVSEITATGLSLGRRTQTISTGTEYTLQAQYQPADASYRDTLWSSDNEAVATVDSRGTVYGRSAGVARIYAASRAGHTAFCEITVTEAPTLVVGINKSVTLSVQGFAQDDTDILWEQGTGAVMSASPSGSGSFSTEQYGTSRLRVSPLSEGSTLITAVIRRNLGTGDVPEYAVIGRQSWRIEGVVPLKHLKLVSSGGETIKKLTLCADPSGLLSPETAALTAMILDPENATELGYVWSSRNSEIASVEALPGSKLRASARVTAVGSGTTQITATNYNTGRRVSVTVTVRPYPSGLRLLSASDVNLRVGKRSSIRAKVSGASGADTVLLYRVADGPGNSRPHTDADPIATVDAKGRVTAVRSGTVTVTALAKPYGEGALSASVNVLCSQPVRDISLSVGSGEILTRGGTSLEALFSPSDASDRAVTFTVSDPSVLVVREYSFGYAVEGLRPGKARITAISGDGRKKAAVTIIVR